MLWGIRATATKLQKFNTDVPGSSRKRKENGGVPWRCSSVIWAVGGSAPVSEKTKQPEVWFASGSVINNHQLQQVQSIVPGSEAFLSIPIRDSSSSKQILKKSLVGCLNNIRCSMALLIIWTMLKHLQYHNTNITPVKIWFSLNNRFYMRFSPGLWLGQFYHKILQAIKFEPWLYIKGHFPADL